MHGHMNVKRDNQYYHTLECDAVSSSTVKMTAKTGGNFLPD